MVSTKVSRSVWSCACCWAVFRSVCSTSILPVTWARRCRSRFLTLPELIEVDESGLIGVQQSVFLAIQLGELLL